MNSAQIPLAKLPNEEKKQPNSISISILQLMSD